MTIEDASNEFRSEQTGYSLSEMYTAEAADRIHLTLRTQADDFTFFSYFFFLLFNIAISFFSLLSSSSVQLSEHILYVYMKDVSQSLLSTFQSMRSDLFMNCVTFQEEF